MRPARSRAKAAHKGPRGACTLQSWHHPRASSLKMLGLSLWEGRLPGQKTIENEDKAAMGSYRPESNFGTKRHRDRLLAPTGRLKRHEGLAGHARGRSQTHKVLAPAATVRSRVAQTSSYRKLGTTAHPYYWLCLTGFGPEQRTYTVPHRALTRGSKFPPSVSGWLPNISTPRL